MNQSENSTNSESNFFDIVRKIIFQGILVFLTVTSVSILHANQYEFIVLRFPWLTLFEVSLFDSILYLSYLIMGIIAGILSDRLGKRKIFIVIGSGFSAFFFYMMTTNINYPNALNYDVLLFFRFFQGAATVLSWQIIMTIIMDVSSSENRGKSIGIFSIFLVLAMGFGPILGGVLASTGIFVPYYVATILSGVVFVSALIFVKEPSEIKKNPSLKKILPIVWRNPKLIVPGLFNFVDRLHMGFLIFMLPLYLQYVFYIGPELRGMVLGMYALPVIILQYPIGKLSDTHGRYKPLIVGSLGYGFILAILAFFGYLGFSYLIFFFILLGIFAGITTSPAMALVGDIVKKEENAMGIGFFNFLGNVGIIVGPLIAGFVSTYSNFSFAFLIAGLIELVTLGINILVAFGFKEIKIH